MNYIVKTPGHQWWTLKRCHDNSLIPALALVWIWLCSVSLVKDYIKVSYGGFDICWPEVRCRGLSAETILFGPLRRTSVLSGFNCRKLSAIQFFIAFRQRWGVAVLLISHHNRAPLCWNNLSLHVWEAGSVDISESRLRNQAGNKCVLFSLWTQIIECLLIDSLVMDILYDLCF